ncbi:MAG: hypothetical protein LBK62_12210 [Treponema sp.]|nr:hypothetical protein [Treponema sp.]
MKKEKMRISIVKKERIAHNGLVTLFWSCRTNRASRRPGLRFCQVIPLCFIPTQFWWEFNLKKQGAVLRWKRPIRSTGPRLFCKTGVPVLHLSGIQIVIGKLYPFRNIFNFHTPGTPSKQGGSAF